MPRPALLIIDMCQDFFAEGRLLDLRPNLSKAINDVVSFFRKSCFPIVWVRQEFEPDLSDAFISMRRTGTRITIKGTDGAKLLPELDVRPNDLEVVKKRYSAFFGTNLESELCRLKATHLVLAGVNTHACIRTTAVDAFQRDYEVIFAVQGVNSYDEGFHKDSVRYLEGRIGRFMSNKNIIEKFSGQ